MSGAWQHIEIEAVVVSCLWEIGIFYGFIA